MMEILVGTEDGCWVFDDDDRAFREMLGHSVAAIWSTADGESLAILDGFQISQRVKRTIWTEIGRSNIPLQSLVKMNDRIFVGGMEEAVLLQISGTTVCRVEAFDHVDGREHWFAGGPPLGIRSLAVTRDSSALLAAVHVGGIPRSGDLGVTWVPTLPVMHDVHEVCASPWDTKIVAAATAVGLCLSRDAGLTREVFSAGLEGMTCLAVDIFQDEVLFSVQDSPFATRSQLWKFDLNTGQMGPVMDGLPEWLAGKIDTGWIRSGGGITVLVDGGGHLWRTHEGTRQWSLVTEGLPYVLGLAISSKDP